MPTARRALGAATSLVWVVAALTLGWLLWPSSLGGCTTLTIVSGHSMEPTYYTGDLVVSRCGPVQVGDVIVYSPPNVGGARVIHRIVDGDADDGWIVQGDNNDFLDPWTPTAEHILGSSVLHLPHVGKVAAILLSPLTWLSLLVVALAVVVWPGKREDDGDGEGGADGHGADDHGADDHGADDDGAPGAPSDPLGVFEPAVNREVHPVNRVRADHSHQVTRRLARRAVIAAVLVLPLGLSAGIAQAAGLNLGPASLSAFAVGHPCPGTMTVTTPPTTGTSSSVLVTPPAACAGLEIKVAVGSGANARQGEETAPASGSVTVPLNGDFTPSGSVVVAATVAGWHLPVSWSYTPPAAISCRPVDPSVRATCTATMTRVDRWPSGYRAYFSVSTTSATPFDWQVDLNLSAAPFPGYPVPADDGAWTPTTFTKAGVCSASTTAQLPVVMLRGETWNRQVSSSTARAGEFGASRNGGQSLGSFVCR